MFLTVTLPFKYISHDCRLCRAAMLKQRLSYVDVYKLLGGHCLPLNWTCLPVCSGTSCGSFCIVSDLDTGWKWKLANCADLSHRRTSNYRPEMPLSSTRNCCSFIWLVLRLKHIPYFVGQCLSTVTFICFKALCHFCWIPHRCSLSETGVSQPWRTRQNPVVELIYLQFAH